MRTLRISLFTLSILSLIACGGEASKEAGSEEDTMTDEAAMEGEDNYDQMTKVNLSDYDIAASIYIPDESKGKSEIQATDWGSITINVGKNFGIELVPFGMSIEEKKAELDGDLVYTVEYLEETPESIYYTKTIRDSDMEPEYHFFSNKEIEGDIIEVKNIEDGMFKKTAIELMMKSARSLK